MSVVDELQSAIMYRTGNLVQHGAWYLLIVYVVSATLLLAIEGAHASLSQGDIKEAEKIVGNFLRNEAGTTWLSGLAKTRSAPLTTQDLMNEILEATRPGGRVWQAASILSESLKEQALKGIKTESILSKAENWKDIIEHIEDQDDIICLYRKNTEETAKKADDWKKFLKSVSPGYTVHLAIDTGRKYVICLKKVEVEETTPEEILTTQGALSTVVASVDPTVITTEIIFPTTKASRRSAIIPTGGILKKENDSESDVKSGGSDESCDDEDVESIENSAGEDSNNNDGVDDEDIADRNDGYDNNVSSEEEYSGKKANRRMEDDLSENFDDYPVNNGQDGNRPIPPSLKQREFYLRSNDRSLVGSSLRTSESVDPKSSKDPECNRPIILLVQDGGTRLGYRLRTPSGIPIQGNFRATNLPRLPSRFRRFPKMPPKLPFFPQHPMNSPKTPGRPFNPVMLPNNSPQLTKSRTLNQPLVNVKTPIYIPGPRPTFSHNSKSVYNISFVKVRKPVDKLVANSVVKPFAQLAVVGPGEPIMQTRNVFLPQRANVKPRGSGSIRQEPDLAYKLRYPIEPKESKRFSSSPITDSAIRRQSRNDQSNDSNSIDRKYLINKSSLNFPSRFPQLRYEYPAQEFPERYNGSHLPTQMFIIGAPPRRFPRKRKRIRIHIDQSYPPSIHTRTSGQSAPKIDRKILGGYSSPADRGVNRNNPQLANILRQKPSAEDLQQSPYSNFNSNYPTTNHVAQLNKNDPRITKFLKGRNSPIENLYPRRSSNLHPDYPMTNNFAQSNVLTQTRPGSPPLIRPCLIPWNTLNASGRSNPSALNFLKYPLARRNNPLICPVARCPLRNNPVPCLSPCDRPVKLQIMINGNVQEPWKVSVISEPGQHVEVLGSGNPMTTQGSRALREGIPLVGDLGDEEENIHSKVRDAKVLGADTDGGENGKVEGEKGEEKLNGTNGEVSSVGSTFDRSEKLDAEDNTNMEFKAQTTTNVPGTESSGGQEIEERFLNDVVVETTSANSTTEINETLTAVTNSTIVD